MAERRVRLGLQLQKEDVFHPPQRAATLTLLLRSQGFKVPVPLRETAAFVLWCALSLGIIISIPSSFFCLHCHVDFA